MEKIIFYCIEASGITNALLHLVGTETQEIHETLQDTENTYDRAITKLNEHLNVKKNIPHERSVFREAKQETKSH